MVRWLGLAFAVLACAGGSSCPKPLKKFEVPLDSTGCECKPGQVWGNHPDLACVCKSGRCPRDVADGLALVRGACEEGEEHRAYRAEGCGYVVVGTTNGTCAMDFAFDEKSGKLVGGFFRCDVLPEAGSCDSAYDFGAPLPDCPHVKTCSVCGKDSKFEPCDEALRCGP